MHLLDSLYFKILSPSGLQSIRYENQRCFSTLRNQDLGFKSNSIEIEKKNEQIKQKLSFLLQSKSTPFIIKLIDSLCLLVPLVWKAYVEPSDLLYTI